AFFNGSAIQWPLSNTFEASNKRQSGEIQKNINQDRQGGTHFSMTAYPGQQNAHSVHLPHDVKMLSSSNTVAMNNPFFTTHFAGAGQNFPGAHMKQQLLGGVPVTAPQSIFPVGSVAGTTEPWFTSKGSRAPAQLTIFYAGTVNVFNDISPEKAQAIMFLAGNGCSVASNVPPPRSQAQAPNPKMAEDVVFVNQPMNTPPSSALSSPLSVSSHPVGQPVGGSAKNDGPVKTTEGLASPVTKVDSPKIPTSTGHASNTNMISPSAVPQARKASLARFLEKRKERVMNSAPYNLSMKSAECATPGSNGVSFSATSGPISAGNESSH
ncbi:hypothetical protein RJ639_001195, partial [Escallonia herrerae]